jgi:hypothetical protein
MGPAISQVGGLDVGSERLALAMKVDGGKCRGGESSHGRQGQQPSGDGMHGSLCHVVR